MEAPEPITSAELELAMTLVKCRFPNTHFVIQKHIEELNVKLKEHEKAARNLVDKEVNKFITSPRIR